MIFVGWGRREAGSEGGRAAEALTVGAVESVFQSSMHVFAKTKES